MPKRQRDQTLAEYALIGVLIIFALAVLPTLLYLAIQTLTGNATLALVVSVGWVLANLIGGAIGLVRKLFPD